MAGMQQCHQDFFDGDGAGYTLEAALELVGTGHFQWLMLTICGLANAADAVEIMSIGLVSTAAEEDLQLTAERQGILNACLLLGMFLGGLTWGLLGDHLGRKQSLLLALLVNGGFGSLSSASQALWQMVLLRMLAGIGVGGSMPIVFAQMSEFCPLAARGKFMALLASTWMLGSLYSASTGWLVIPSAGWRAFLLLASAPAWVCAVLVVLLMPESPRYLLVSGKQAQAVQVLQRVAAANKHQLPPNFQLVPLQQTDSVKLQLLNSTDLDKPSMYTHLSAADHQLIEPHSRGRRSIDVQARTDISEHLLLHTSHTPASAPQHPPEKAKPLWQHQLRHWHRTVSSTARVLLVSPLKVYTYPLMLAWIGLCGGWYCTVLWVPKYFQLRGAKGGSVYAQTFAVAAANLPGNIASIYLVDHLGRRLTACVCMASACVCALLFAAAPAHGAWPTIAAAVFNGISVGGWNSLDIISSELYPTQVRSSGFGLLNAIGRVSAFISTYLAGVLLDAALWAPLVLASGLLAIGSAAMMRLPEPAGRPLEDVLQQHYTEGMETELPLNTSLHVAGHPFGRDMQLDRTALLGSHRERSAA